MKITPKPIPQTFTDLIDGLHVGNTRLFNLDCKSGVRSAIYRIQQRTEKRFATRKFVAPIDSKKHLDYIEVTRIK